MTKITKKTMSITTNQEVDSMKRMIVAAAGDKNPLDDLLDSIDDDYDYAVAGIEKLKREGDNKAAMEQAQKLSQALQSVIDAISNEI